MHSLQETNSSPAVSLILRESKTAAERILVKSNKRIVVIPVDQIEVCLAREGYTEVWTAEKSYLHDASLEYLENRLPQEKFFRIHRGIICRVDGIQNVVSDGKKHYHIEFSHSKHPILAVARRKYRPLKELLNSRT